MVFQNYNLFPHKSALENVMEGLITVKKMNKATANEEAMNLLAKVGLVHVKDQRPHALSGGQQQRVAIARALVSEAPIILADEPTGNLDEETAKEIIAILKRMALDRQKCVIVVTHSKEVAQASDVVLELKKKQLIEKKK